MMAALGKTCRIVDPQGRRITSRQVIAQLDVYPCSLQPTGMARRQEGTPEHL
jgi:hypothetical protein